MPAGLSPLELEVFRTLIDLRRFHDKLLVLSDEERDLWELELQQLLALVHGEIYLAPPALRQWTGFWTRLDYDLEEVLRDGLKLVQASRASGQSIHIATQVVRGLGNCT